MDCFRGGWRLAGWGLLLSAAWGCAAHKQVQYFAATDPETGLTNYYKMTVKGTGGFGVDYHLQAGYFSAAAVDMLRGSMPDVPELDLPIEQLEVFDRLTQHFYAALIQEVKRVHNVADPEAILIAAESSRNMVVHRSGKVEVKAEQAQRLVTRAEDDLNDANLKKDEAENNYKRITEQVENTRSELNTKRSEAASKNTELNSANRAVSTKQGEIKKAEEALKKLDEATKAVTVKQKDLEDAEKAFNSATEENKPAAQAVVDAKKNELKKAQDILAALKPENRPTLVADITNKKNELEAARGVVSTKQGELEPLQAKAIELENRLLEEKSVQRDASNKLTGEELNVASKERAAERARQKSASLNNDLARQKAAQAASEKMLELLRQRMELVPSSSLADPEHANPFNDDKIIELARVVWFGSLSSSDLASIGMTGNTSPYQFRKLVFWTTATNIDLNEFATEIDAVLDNSLSIASAAKAQAKQRKAERESRRQSMDDLLDSLPLQGLGPDGVRGLMDLLNPPPPATSEEETGGVTP